ncbi:hypothetical protein KR038_002594 [Drosophila bunnanda]|nr:hypothetical protein KR038_002594 [Drosophila bunnanda]
MKSHIIPQLLLVGIICAALIAAHSHDWIGLSEEDEASGSGHNSAEEFMNEMEAVMQILEEEYNATYHSSGDYNDEETILGPHIVKISS